MMNWMTSSWVFYTLMYRGDLDYGQLRKDDLVQMLNFIRLHYLNRMGNDDDFSEFDFEFKQEIKYWLGDRKRNEEI